MQNWAAITPGLLTPWHFSYRSLSPPRSINWSSKLSGKPNGRGSLVMDWHPIQGVVVMLMVPLCKGNLDKLWLGIGYLAQLQTSNLLCQPNTVFSDLNHKILWIYRTNYFKKGTWGKWPNWTKNTVFTWNLNELISVNQNWISNNH